MHAIRIFPSILNANFDNLPGEIKRVAETADYIHLDVMDNIFVPNFTFDFDRASSIIDSSVLPIDVHLMVDHADIIAPRYAQTNAASITFHIEATRDVASTISQVKEHGKRVGLAIKPNTPIEVIEPFLRSLDMILVMTVEPGFGGQKFMSDMMPKVKQAREWLDREGLRDTWLQLDGGISLETIGIGALAGADTFVAGSAVYRAENPAVMVEELRHRALTCMEQK